MCSTRRTNVQHGESGFDKAGRGASTGVTAGDGPFLDAVRLLCKAMQIALFT
jgi:hypothetical protein